MRPARTARLLALLSASALAIGLGPTIAPATGADAPVPVYSFLQLTARIGANAIMTPGPTTPWPAVYLTPEGVSPTTYDVSADGSSLALAGTARGADATASLVVGPTQGLVLVRRADGVTTSRVIATHWSLNPVLSADGATLWWTYRGAAYRWTAGATTLLSATLFPPRAGETMTAFAVSPDGQKGAALYWSATGARLFAADFRKGRTVPYIEQRYPASLGPLAPDCFAWLDDATVMFRPTATPNQIRYAPLDSLGDNSSTIVHDTAGWYFPRLVGSHWWVWDHSTTPYGSVWRYRAVATPLTGGTIPAQSATTQLNANDSQHPVMSLTTPPGLGETADVRAWGTGRLTLSTSAIVYGGRALDIAYGQYLAPLPGESLAASGAKVAGMLQISYDGTTWRNLRWNNLQVVPWPGTTTAANGYVTVTRSVWVRYQYRGDPLVLPMTSPVRRLTVTPLVRVTVTPSRSGRSRLVAGTVTRIGGRALLYRYISGRYVVIAQTTISSTGRYSFGWRVLPRGAYKVASVADVSWNSGRVFFRI